MSKDRDRQITYYRKLQKSNKIILYCGHISQNFEVFVIFRCWREVAHTAKGNSLDFLNKFVEN